MHTSSLGFYLGAPAGAGAPFFFSFAKKTLPVLELNWLLQNRENFYGLKKDPILSEYTPGWQSISAIGNCAY